ncbi:lamin tail domain-containing protein [Poritiphilus flavus]|uniref:Uncharacterized protein n=1 Tax=Poritiphilus flavus TaxID=2697053 RepID=A0A6L9EHL7_9FLAO|nr:lamin tail domain-containing protein [Poritiphilus flavus]NAS14185.1 hypothetical protein [Poritiphilus flavus]
MKKNLLYLFAVLTIVASFSGCSEKQDFDQFDDLDITPTVEASIIYIESPENLINLAAGINFFTGDFNFDAFNEDFVAERVLEGLVIYELENTTSKPIDVSFQFLDAAGNILDTESFSIPPAPTAVLRREVAYGGATGRSIDIITNTSAIRVNAINQGDSTSVSSLPDPKIILRSSAQLRIRLK